MYVYQLSYYKQHLHVYVPAVICAHSLFLFPCPSYPLLPRLRTLSLSLSLSPSLSLSLSPCFFFLLFISLSAEQNMIWLLGDLLHFMEVSCSFQAFCRSLFRDFAAHNNTCIDCSNHCVTLPFALDSPVALKQFHIIFE